MVDEQYDRQYFELVDKRSTTEINVTIQNDKLSCERSLVQEESQNSQTTVPTAPS